VPEEGHNHLATGTANSRVGAHGFGESRIALRVRNVEWHAFTDDLHVWSVGGERPRIASPQNRVTSGVEAPECGEFDLSAIDPCEKARMCFQEAHGTGQDRVEHRLHVRLRLTDDAQNVTGRGLLVQSSGQVTVARLQLLEQPHILDGNNCLVSEGLEHGDFAVGEWTEPALWPPTPDGDYSNWLLAP